MPAIFDMRSFYAGIPVVQFGYEFGDDTEVTDFTGTAVTSGTFAVQSAKGGVARLSGAATTDASGYEIQHEKCPVLFAKNDYLTAVFQAKHSNVNLGWVLGIAASDTSLIASVPSDGVYLQKTKGTEVVSLVVRSGSAGILTKSLGALGSTGNYQTWAIEVAVSVSDATQGVVSVFLNGSLVLKTDTITIPNGVQLGLSAAAQSGSAASTQYLDIDCMAYRFKR